MNERPYEKITQVLDEAVEAKELPAISALVAKGSQVEFRYCSGVLDIETGAQVRSDSLFRIYSMTKPITAFVAMRLVERGLLNVETPVSEYLPELNDLQVLNEGHLKAAKPMQIWHLLTHTSGLTYGYYGDTEIDRLYRERDLVDDWNYLVSDTHELVSELASIPLLFQPGERWHYGFSSDVLGHLLERLTGTPLDELFAEEVFEPLGVYDAYFEVPEREHHRFGTNQYVTEPGSFRLQDSPRQDCEFSKVSFLSGGGGLVMTLEAFYRFAELFRGRGIYRNTRLISPESIDSMVRNQLESRMTQGDDFGYGFGLGVTPTTSRSGVMSNGSFYWGGAAGTMFWVDPVKDLLAIFLTQCLNRTNEIHRRFQGTVYEVMGW